jgi:hypothetical protein
MEAASIIRRDSPMPIKFPCQSCRRILSVSSRKVGRKAQCPKCGQPLVVPTAEEAETALALVQAALVESTLVESTLVESERAPGKEPEDDPLAQFVIYDDEEDFHFDKTAADNDAPPRDAERIDPSRVALPRIVLYVQGVLLGVVALVFFTLGLVIGMRSGGGGDEQAGRPRPCEISGAVVYMDEAQRQAPDQGAVVIVLPKGTTPADKIDYQGLGPHDPAPPAGHAGVAAIQRIGGGFARADVEGKFTLRVPDRGDYYVLVISAGENRPDGAGTDRRVLAELGNYFTSATDLLGRSLYRWEEERVQYDRQMNVQLN